VSERASGDLWRALVAIDVSVLYILSSLGLNPTVQSTLCSLYYCSVTCSRLLLEDMSYLFRLGTAYHQLHDTPYLFRDLLDITTRINDTPVIGIPWILLQLFKHLPYTFLHLFFLISLLAISSSQRSSITRQRQKYNRIRSRKSNIRIPTPRVIKSLQSATQNNTTFAAENATPE
jgi:hypothetical protein